MQTENENIKSRREFLKIAASVAGTVVVAGGSAAVILSRKDEELTSVLWRLNPAFRVHEISTDKIELVTQLGTGEMLKHQFTGVEADLFRAIADEHLLDEMLSSVARRNNLTVQECQKKMNASIRELEEARLIYTGEKMLVKVVEVKND